MGSMCDIRRIHDPKEYPNVISRLLQTHPPSGVPLLDSAGHPLPEGLDCLTHLIRHLRAQWQDYFENAEDEEEEAINPILRYAWLKFYPDSEDPEEDVELVEEARKAKGDVSRALQLVHVDLEHMGEFLELCCSPLMNQTLWSRREWCLLHSILYRNANEPIWREKACPGREESGRQSLLHYDCRIEKNLSLQDFIRTQFEPRINADGSSELWLSRAPKVVRVLYNASTTARQSYHDLRDFEMPLVDYTRAAEWLNYVGTFDDMPRVTSNYTLLAVVRCGDTQTGVDVIRTYRPYTSPVFTSYLRSFLGSQPDWSLQDDTPAQYLLVYGRLARGRICDMVFDESWPVFPDDKKVQEIMDWFSDAHLEEMSKPQPHALGTRPESAVLGAADQPHDAEHVGDGGEGGRGRGYNDPGPRGAGREAPDQGQIRDRSRGRGYNDPRPRGASRETPDQGQIRLGSRGRGYDDPRPRGTGRETPDQEQSRLGSRGRSYNDPRPRGTGRETPDQGQIRSGSRSRSYNDPRPRGASRETPDQGQIRSGSRGRGYNDPRPRGASRETPDQGQIRSGSRGGRRDNSHHGQRVEQEPRQTSNKRQKRGRTGYSQADTYQR